MTMCLTFDDGLKTHAEIAAPMLKERGWSGAFCVPTAFMDVNSRTLTAEQVKDLCLEGNEHNLMSWDDARQMIADGHEIYPHTHDHVDLVDLYMAGKKDVVEQQIVKAKESFEKVLGMKPAFFCLPHYSTCAYVDSRIRAHRMEVFNCGRSNFGEKYSPGQISKFIANRKRAGWRHFDISVHGISKDTGGWAPFKTVDDFAGFLDEIKAAENQGEVHVVPYLTAHRQYSFISKYLVLMDRIVNRASVWCATH